MVGMNSAGSPSPAASLPSGSRKDARGMVSEDMKKADFIEIENS